MGFSKKRLIRKKKADKRVGPKAKRKAKQAQLIEKRKKLLSSKRKATALTERHVRHDDELQKSLDTVNILFKSITANEELVDSESDDCTNDAKWEDEGGRFAFEHDDASRETPKLDLERFHLIRDSALSSSSFTSCRAVMHAYGAAVGSLKGKGQQGWFQVNDAHTCREVLQWSACNMLKLIRQCSGQSSASKTAKKKRKSADSVDAQSLAEWSCVSCLAHEFWKQSLILLQDTGADENTKEELLRSCSSPEGLFWLAPFRALHARYIECCCELWSSNLSILAFLFIRNSCGFVQFLPATRQASRLEAWVREMFVKFSLTSGGNSHNRAGHLFLETSLLELLRMDDGMARRIGHDSLKELAQNLRDCSVAVDERGLKRREALNEDIAVSKWRQLVPSKGIVSWSCVRLFYFWTRAVESLPVLKPLAHPLTLCVLGAAKCRMVSLVDFPFVYHCLTCVNALAGSLEVYVPISSYLLRILSLVSGVEKSHIDGPRLDLDLYLSFSEGVALETIGDGIAILLFDHFGMLSRCPAFPEIIAPTLPHLRRQSFKCPSERLRKQLRTFVAAAETTMTEVRTRREALTECTKLFVFESTSLSKARATFRRGT